MKINILSYEPPNGWILWDYAVRIAIALEPIVQKIVISHSQLDGFDLTYHVNYAGFNSITASGVHTTMVTHIDTPQKLHLVANQAKAGAFGICMSEDTARRLRQLTGENRFAAALTPSLLPKRDVSLRVTIGSRIYPDGRKNEWWVLDFARKFQSGDLILKIMGSGWEQVIAEIERLGHKVHYYPSFDKALYIDLLKNSDYVLYTGFDEGSLSTIDASAYGIPFIATTQGFHLELPGNNMLYSSFEELMQIASKLQFQLQSIQASSEMLVDWEIYAKKLLRIWSLLVADSKNPSQ